MGILENLVQEKQNLHSTESYHYTTVIMQLLYHKLAIKKYDHESLTILVTSLNDVDLTVIKCTLP